MSEFFKFTRAERVQLYGEALKGFIAQGFEHLPPRGKPDEHGKLPEGKVLPGRFDRCAAAWALSTVDSLEYSIRSDQEYWAKKAEEKSRGMGAAKGGGA